MFHPSHCPASESPRCGARGPSSRRGGESTQLRAAGSTRHRIGHVVAASSSPTLQLLACKPTSGRYLSSGFIITRIITHTWCTAHVASRRALAGWIGGEEIRGALGPHPTVPGFSGGSAPWLPASAARETARRRRGGDAKARHARALDVSFVHELSTGSGCTEA